MRLSKYLVFAFILCSLHCGPPVQAAPPVIDGKSPGIFLLRTGKGMFLTAILAVAYDDISNSDSYQVVLMTPSGQKIPVPAQQKLKNIVLYWPAASGIPADEDYQKGRLTGDYTFELKDKDGAVVGTYVDFLLPYRDEAYEGMGAFEDASVVPQDGSEVKQGDLVMTWNPVKGASRYRVNIYKEKGQGQLIWVFEKLTDETRVIVPAEKIEPGKYVLKLDAIHEEDRADWGNMVRYTRPDGEPPVFYVK